MNQILKYINLPIRKFIKYNIYKFKAFYQLAMAKQTEQRADRIIWIDLEMSGLNIYQDKILEVASLITDNELNIVSEAFEIVINQPESVLLTMNSWCTEQHNKTGLIEESRDSIFDEKLAEDEFLKFLKKYSVHNTCPIAGNCIYMDKMFIKKYMPRIYNHLGNDVIDVSSINELAKRWNKKIEKKKKRKTGNHRALGDIRDSIAELNYYRTEIFKLG